MLRFIPELLVIIVLLTDIIPGKEKNGKQEKDTNYFPNSLIINIPVS